MSPLISIIMPSYNKGRYLADAINSVISQTYQNWELIVVDDVSNDNSFETLNAFAEKDIRIKFYINSKNKGANFSRNFGLSIAKGDFIIFLDADDILFQDCLKNRLDKIEKSNLDFCVFTMQIFNKTIGDLKNNWDPETKTPLINFLSHRLPWQTMQPIWKRSFLIGINGFDEDFKRLQDVELHTRALLNNNVNFKLFNTLPDCFLRIDDERKNFNSIDFLNKWIDSSEQYCNKFEKLVPANYKKYLHGTIFRSYQQILLYYKLNKITKDDFLLLGTKLFSVNVYRKTGKLKKLIYKIVCFYNLYLFRVPGINQFLYRLILL